MATEKRPPFLKLFFLFFPRSVPYSLFWILFSAASELGDVSVAGGAPPHLLVLSLLPQCHPHRKGACSWTFKIFKRFLLLQNPLRKFSFMVVGVIFVQHKSSSNVYSRWHFLALVLFCHVLVLDSDIELNQIFSFLMFSSEASGLH